MITTNKLSDLEEKEALYILEKYLIKDQIFPRLQKDARSGLKRCDLNYILTDIVNKMYVVKNNTGDIKNPVSRNKDKYIFADKIPKDIFMNKEFIKRLDSKEKIHAVFIPRFLIEKYLSMLSEYHEAILKKAIFPDVRLKTLSKKLSKHETEILRLSYQTKKNHTKKALKALYDLIIQCENDIISVI